LFNCADQSTPCTKNAAPYAKLNIQKFSEPKKNLDPFILNSGVKNATETNIDSNIESNIESNGEKNVDENQSTNSIRAYFVTIDPHHDPGCCRG
jgi:hypothetical protein